MSQAAQFDLVIIGAGSAGEAAAELATARGARVAVVERDLVGGDCPFRSCMPSKSLIHDAARRAMGGRASWEEAATRRDEVIERGPDGRSSDAGHVRSLERAGAVLVRATGRLAGPGRVVVTGDAGEHVLRARAIILAVGSKPRIPSIEGLDSADPWTTADATTARRLPGSMVVVGAGPAGLELGQMFTRFGVRTTVIASGRIYPHGHERSAEILATALRRDGIRIRSNVRAERVWAGPGPSDDHRVVLSDGSEVSGEVILLATGRTSPLGALGLETIGVEVDGDRPSLGPDLAIAEGVYLAGDPAAVEGTTHLAHYQGQVAARAALGEPMTASLRAVPGCVFTDPEIASVGLQLDAALEVGHAAFEESIALADTARGVAAEAIGHVSIVADRRSGQLLGAFAAGPGATEAIHEAVLAMRAEIHLSVLADTIHAFPTTARVFGELCQRALPALETGRG